MSEQISEQILNASSESVQTTPPRRHFLQSAFMTAAGVAVGSLFVAGEADAQNRLVPVRSGRVHVVFNEGKVTTESVFSSIAQIVNIAGCTNCGMVGFDISFLRGDPIAYDAASLPAVQSILVSPL